MSTVAEPAAAISEEALLRRRAGFAVAQIERALAEHGPSRHPLIDVLLDLRNTLCGQVPP